MRLGTGVNRRIAELLGRDPEEPEHLRELAAGDLHPQEVACRWARKDDRKLRVLAGQ